MSVMIQFSAGLLDEVLTDTAVKDDRSRVVHSDLQSLHIIINITLMKIANLALT